MEEFIGHKLSDDGQYYSIRGNLIVLNDINEIIPEYHNSGRSLYMKILKKSGGKNIIKLKNKKEYNFIISTICSITAREDLASI